MTVPSQHIDDDTLSSVVDDQLTAQERVGMQAHLRTCADCLARLEEFRSVATLLRGLPEVELPGDFSLGPRVVVESTRIVYLRRWYTVTRVAAASLAAVFVFLAAGALYVDSRPAPPAAVVSISQPPAAAAGASAPTSVSIRAAAPAPAAAQRAPANPQADDQVAAATSVSPLPTPIPTPLPTLAPVPVGALAVVAADPGAPWRTAAAIAGLLAVLALFATLVVRHRLPQT